MRIARTKVRGAEISRERMETWLAVNHTRRFSCVSSITSVFFALFQSRSLAVAAYLSDAKIFQNSEIFYLVTHNLARKNARKAKITLVRKQQIASYLSLKSNSKNMSHQTLTNHVFTSVLRILMGDMRSRYLSQLRAWFDLFKKVCRTQARSPVFHPLYSLLIPRTNCHPWPGAYVYYTSPQISIWFQQAYLL